MTLDRVRDSLEERDVDLSVTGVLMALLMLPLRVAAFLWRQVTGTAGNIVDFFQWFQFDYVLPPAIRDTVQWTLQIIPQAAGLRDTSKNRQVTSAAVVLFVAFLSTLLTGGLAIAIYAVAAVALALGLFRFVPAVNKGWREFRSRLPVKNDYDVWRWSRE